MSDFIPLKTDYAHAQKLNTSPFLGVINDVVTPQECKHLMALVTGRMKRAKVSLDKKGDITPGRSGSNSWLRYSEDPVVHRIGQRIADLVGMPLEHAEAMQVIHYGPGEEYRSHYDAYDLTTERGQRCCRFGGQRLLTALVYLNQADLGGGTHFAKLGQHVEAKQGRLVLFHNVEADGFTPHPDSLHAGSAVKQGEKWAFNIWFHARPMSEKQVFQTPIYVTSTTSHAPSKHPTNATTSPRPLVVSRVNRAVPVFQQAIQKLDPVLVEKAQPLCVTYWDTYRQTAPDLQGLPHATRVLALVDRRITNRLANQATLAQSLIQHQLEKLAPPTYFSVQDALDHQAEPVPFWSILNALGTREQAEYIVSQEHLAEVTLQPNQLLRALETVPTSVAGQAFSARLYALIWQHSIYVYDDGLMFQAKEEYDPSTTHLMPSSIITKSFTQHPNHFHYSQKIRELMQALRPLLADTCDAADANHYVFLGVDVACRPDGTVRLLGLHNAPNFIHARDIIENVHVPFFYAALTTMLGGTSAALTAL